MYSSCVSVRYTLTKMKCIWTVSERHLYGKRFHDVHLRFESLWMRIYVWKSPIFVIDTINWIRIVLFIEIIVTGDCRTPIVEWKRQINKLRRPSTKKKGQSRWQYCFLFLLHIFNIIWISFSVLVSNKRLPAGTLLHRFEEQNNVIFDSFSSIFFFHIPSTTNTCHLSNRHDSTRQNSNQAYRKCFLFLISFILWLLPI